MFNGLMTFPKIEKSIVPLSATKYVAFSQVNEFLGF